MLEPVPCPRCQDWETAGCYLCMDNPHQDGPAGLVPALRATAYRLAADPDGPLQDLRDRDLAKRLFLLFP